MIYKNAAGLLKAHYCFDIFKYCPNLVFRGKKNYFKMWLFTPRGKKKKKILLRCFFTHRNLQSHSESASKHLKGDKKPPKGQNSISSCWKSLGMRCLHSRKMQRWPRAELWQREKKKKIKNLQLCQGLDFQQGKWQEGESVKGNYLTLK